jgi:RNA polymerase sigma factor (sigma-70 family)
MNRLVRFLHRAVASRESDGVSDGQLLEQYLRREDEAAFALLVRRHGPMVLGVCRRILHNTHDAEDAFQATFLVLIRRAAVVWPRDRVGAWLYGVACRTALKARARSERRRTREQPLEDVADPAAEDKDLRELRALLDHELSRLPEKYRLAVLLCDLEGQTHQQVAERLGWPMGTVSTRLHHGRKLLARRLGRLGLGVTAGTLAVTLARVGRAGDVPPALIAAIAAAARLFAAEPAAAAGLISSETYCLAQEVLKTMMLTRIKMMVALMAACLLLGTGSGLALHAALAGQQQVQDPNLRVQKQGTDPQPKDKKNQTDNAPLERRLAALEDQIARLLKEVQSLRRELKAGATTSGRVVPKLPTRGELRVFTLRFARAAEVAKVLQELFVGPKGRDTDLRIVSSGTNTLIVYGTQMQLDQIEALLVRLEDSAARQQILEEDKKKK